MGYIRHMHLLIQHSPILVHYSKISCPCLQPPQDILKNLLRLGRATKIGAKELALL